MLGSIQLQWAEAGTLRQEPVILAPVGPSILEYTGCRGHPLYSRGHVVHATLAATSNGQA